MTSHKSSTEWSSSPSREDPSRRASRSASFRRSTIERRQAWTKQVCNGLWKHHVLFPYAGETCAGREVSRRMISGRDRLLRRSWCTGSLDGTSLPMTRRSTESGSSPPGFASMIRTLSRPSSRSNKVRWAPRGRATRAESMCDPKRQHIPRRHSVARGTPLQLLRQKTTTRGRRAEPPTSFREVGPTGCYSAGKLSVKKAHSRHVFI